MKVAMMIKALILVHLWSLVVAGIAWILQRDGNGKVGASFPAANIWLGLILISILPGLLFVIPFDAVFGLPKIEMPEVFSSQASDVSVTDSSPLNYLAIYIGLGILLMGRTLWQWSRLQKLPFAATPNPDVFTTTSDIPPLTLSWPRRAVLIPSGLETQTALIAHERTHLRHYDAELTLLLLLLRDLMLSNPGIGYLVRQWRLSIELRADHAATQELSASERKNYAALLLNVLRSGGDHAGRRALPCPTAHLTSKRHRDVKMRLTGIIENVPNPHKHRWSVAILLSTFGASLIGFLNSPASATVEVLNMELDQIEYAKQTSPQLPASCPGLKLDDVKYEKTTSTINGMIVPQHVVKLGLVVLKHDVRRDGSAHNPQVIVSTHPCFEANAKTTIAGWVAAPQEFEIKNVAVKMYFVTSAETVEELKLQLDKFLQ